MKRSKSLDRIDPSRIAKQQLLDYFTSAMQEQLSLQKFLQARLEELRIRNPQYSRRAFSRRLGLSPGAISDIFNGRRRVSYKLARKITDRLGLDPQERTELLSPFMAKTLGTITRSDAAGSEILDSDYLQLSTDQFRVIGDWYHFAILVLMRSRGFKSDPQWISDRLGIGKSEVERAIARMVRLGIVERKNGKLTRSKKRYRTTDDVSSVAVRRAHHQYLEKAAEALHSVPVELRDFTSLMMSIDTKKLPRAKEIIRKFQDELSELLEDEPQAEVYQLLIQFFPLTQSKNLKGDGP